MTKFGKSELSEFGDKIVSVEMTSQVAVSKFLRVLQGYSTTFSITWK